MPYHGNDELLQGARAAVARAGARAGVVEIGATVEGRAIAACLIAGPGRTPSIDRPQALVTANLHGNEVIGSEVALRLIEKLTAPSLADFAVRLLERADVVVVPAINLDRRAAAAAALVAGGRGHRLGRANRHGVDLNRNFPVAADAAPVWHPLAGTGRRWLPWYRGPAALSEPESRAVAELAQRLRPCAALALHSPGELFLHPYCYTARPPADLEALREMGRRFTAAQTGRRYRVQQSHGWYAILGDLDDWLYASFGTLAATIELARPWRGRTADLWRLTGPLGWYNPAEPGAVCDDVAAGCLAALQAGVEQRIAHA